MNKINNIYINKIIKKGSKSFYFASKFLDYTTRKNILLLYVWCRYCDDLIDNQKLGFYKKKTIKQKKIKKNFIQIKQKTTKTIKGYSPTEIEFMALQKLIKKTKIKTKTILEHIKGFNQDIKKKKFKSLQDTILYCYYIAGTVGIMIANILGITNKKKLQTASNLGIAFQLTNIARDIIEDSKVGKCYIPISWLKKEKLNKKNFTKIKNRKALSNIAKKILTKANIYYKSTNNTLANLPLRSALALTIAKQIYNEIGKKINKLEQKAWDKRIVISFSKKIKITIIAIWFIIKYKIKKINN